MIFVNTHEAKTRLSELLRLVEEKRERIRVCRNGRPVAELGPVPGNGKDPLDRSPRLGGIEFREDPAKPLSEEDWPDEAR